MKLAHLIFALPLILASQTAWLASGAHGQSVPIQTNSIRGGNLTVEAFDDGFYALRSTTIPGDALRAEVEVDTAA